MECERGFIKSEIDPLMSESLHIPTIFCFESLHIKMGGWGMFFSHFFFKKMIMKISAAAEAAVEG